MRIFERITKLLTASATDEEGADEYRCIRCGESFDRDFHTCPECSGQFVMQASEIDAE